MKYVGVCRIKQGKRTEYELSQAEIEDIKQYIPQALREVGVNEQNPQARGFYEHMGFHEYKRTETDGQGICVLYCYKTIGLLFCLMTVMAGLQSLGVFKKAGERLLGDVKGPGAVSAVVVLQTIAANPGSMLTPYTAVSLGMLGSCLAVAAVRNRMPEKEKNGGEQGAMVSGVPGFSGDYSALIVETNLAVLLVPALWVFPFKKRIPDAILKSEHVTDCTGPAERTGRKGEALWL